MVRHTTRLLYSDDFADRWLTEAVVRLSSSPPAREAARAWLVAYETARAVGIGVGEARRRADAAYHQVTSQPALPAVTKVAERRAA